MVLPEFTPFCQQQHSSDLSVSYTFLFKFVQISFQILIILTRPFAQKTEMAEKMMFWAAQVQVC
jgi:hypothetical protein